MALIYETLFRYENRKLKSFIKRSFNDTFKKNTVY